MGEKKDQWENEDILQWIIIANKRTQLITYTWKSQWQKQIKQSFRVKFTKAALKSWISIRGWVKKFWAPWVVG